MITEPRPPELEPPPGDPVPCGTCGLSILLTEAGWTHLTVHGVPETGWLCPLPHMHLAQPKPRPRPTPIPPVKNPGQARPPAPQPTAPQPPEWPLTPGHQWWEQQP